MKDQPHVLTNKYTCIHTYTSCKPMPQTVNHLETRKLTCTRLGWIWHHQCIDKIFPLKITNRESQQCSSFKTIYFCTTIWCFTLEEPVGWDLITLHFSFFPSLHCTLKSCTPIQANMNCSSVVTIMMLPMVLMATNTHWTTCCKTHTVKHKCTHKYTCEKLTLALLF